jgi:branched-chain amino acid transport system substrate-binding protein
MTKRSSLSAAVALAVVAAMVVPGATADAVTKKKPAKTKPKTTKAPAATTAAPTTAAAAVTTAAPAAAAANPCAAKPDASLDKTYGANAGWAKVAYDCAAASPMKAAGDPIVIGFQNPEGDPNGSFPEYRVAALAAEKYINEELGGIGADYANKKPGRPLKIEVCSMAITPGDSQKCANELAAKKPFAVYSTLNFFGNHFATYNAAKIPVIVGTPISPLDFTAPGTYAIGGGGGCLGVHTGLIDFVTKDVKARNVAVPWANTPPGVFCYNDLEKKPLNVLNGTTSATDNSAALTLTNLKHTGIPILPGQADVTPQAQQVLDFKPDAIVFSAQGADCWTLVSSLIKLGWTAAKIPLVLSGACLDDVKIKQAGEAAKGIYFVGATPITQTAALQGLLKQESELYLSKSLQYGSKEPSKGFATQGFLGIMTIWEMASLAAKGEPAKLTAQGVEDYIAKTAGSHNFGSTPLDCKAAAKPYVSVCQSAVTATQWNGTGYDLKRANFSGLYLIKGTELDLGR